MAADETKIVEDASEPLPPAMLTCIGTDSKYGRVYVENPPTVRYGREEPLFVLRGTDPATPYTVGTYGDSAEVEGSSEEFHMKVSEREKEIETWQEENPDKVKVAD